MCVTGVGEDSVCRDFACMIQVLEGTAHVCYRCLGGVYTGFTDVQQDVACEPQVF
jgi:hypothetical protein